MAKYANEVIKQAQAWVGRCESDGTHRAIIDLYNAHKPLPRGYRVKYTDEWCATFVSAVAVKLGYADIIPPECSCQRMIDGFKRIGAWIENENRTPNPGEIVFYDWQDSGNGDGQGWADHVGIVEKVVDKTITVIEGNYNKAVKRRNLAVNGRYIRGFAVPRYDRENAATAKKSATEVAREVIAGKWGNGADRKNRLEKAGYDYKTIQTEVNKLLE
jgi:hypothetical protein